MGGLIGLERELRAKEAGFRTHFIVALGSALFMIISQFAFSGRFDAARVAAQVVSGIGFIGAGVIIFQKNVVRGVTTAAGLWVAAAIGLACGAGMFDVAGAAALMTVLCLELLHFFHLRYGEKVVDLTLKSQGNQDLLAVLDVLKAEGINVETYSVFGSKVHLTVRLQQRNYVDMLRRLVERLEGFTIEDMN
jgi:putative Mg2+ transporter-C (MgtC) family protein